VGYLFCFQQGLDTGLLPKDQLWGFLVASAVPWTEEGTDEGELVKYGSRQLGGFSDK
jgi:hypothetical protein